MHCANCGAENPDDGNFCVKCGSSLTGAASAAPGTIYSRLWRRLLAYIVDYFALAIGAGLAGFIGGFVAGASEGGGALLSLTLLLVVLLYYPIMESSSLQATLGKLALGIKVTDLQGERIGFLRALGRLLAKLISGLILGIGYIMAAFTRRRQGLHDLMAGTLVVRTSAEPAQVAAAGDGGPVSGGDIAVALLGGFVPIVGILAAIAIPAYQDYTIRSQITEGLNLATAHKMAVAEMWGDGATDFEAMSSESVTGGEEVSGKYVSSVVIEAGAVRITYGGEASQHISGRIVTFVPVLNAAQEVAWVCGYAAVPSGHEAVYEEHAQYSDVPEKYLPRSCRSGPAP